MKTKIILFRWLFLISLFGIAYLAVIHAPLSVEAFRFNDKLNHFVAFFVLAWLSDNAFPGQKIIVKISGLLFYGLLIELIQYPLPYREFSGWDLLADGMGLLLYFLIHRFFVSSVYNIRS